MNFNYFNFTKNILRNAEISEISSRTSMTFFFQSHNFGLGSFYELIAFANMPENSLAIDEQMICQDRRDFSTGLLLQGIEL